MRVARARQGALDAVWWGLAALAVLAAVLLPLLPVDSTRTVSPPFAGPSGALLLGADGLGRDVVSRVAHGGAELILIACCSSAVAVAIGVLLGFLTAGTRWPARLLGAVLDLVLVVPALLILLVATYGLGEGVATMVVVTTLVNAPFIARYTRSLARPLLASDFAVAARASGDSRLLVATREVVPNLVGPLAADAGIRFIGAIYVVAAAAFLGFDPIGKGSDWATMVQSGLVGISLNPWASLAPALAILTVTVPTTIAAERLTRTAAR